MKKLLGFFMLPMLFIRDMNYNLYESAFLPNFAGSGNGHRTHFMCHNNRMTKNRIRNKISRNSRKNNQ